MWLLKGSVRACVFVCVYNVPACTVYLCMCTTAGVCVSVCVGLSVCGFIICSDWQGMHAVDTNNSLRVERV